MNKTIKEAKAFAKDSIEIYQLAKEKGIEIGVAPTFLCLEAVKKINPDMIVAAQNLHYEDHGAYTGEISIPMLKEIGINWSIIGHSERRQYNGESSLSCNRKVLAMIANDMVPVYCCGETLEEFESGITKAIVRDQIRIGLAGVDKEKAKNIVVAYEPIWSIGTGVNASKEIAEELKKQHKFEIDRKKITLKDTIKSLGRYTAEIKFGDGVNAELTINVTGE